MPASTDVLRDALRALPPALYRADPEQLGPLQQLVCDVVDELKAGGMAPEHVLLAVKGIAYEAEMGFASTHLVDQLIKWCLEQYFKEPSAESGKESSPGFDN